MQTRSNRTERTDHRLTTEAKRTLYTWGAGVSDFVLESALTRAVETLAERQQFGLDPARWTAFLQALDAAPRVLPRVQRLFAGPGIFDASGDQ